jgi:hypothetical protein
VVGELSTQSFCRSALTIVVPVGAVNETVSPSAVLGPLLVTVMLTEMVAPGAPVAGETVTDKSAAARTRAVMSVELLAGVGSISEGSTGATEADPPVCRPSGAFGEMRYGTSKVCSLVGFNGSVVQKMAGWEGSSSLQPAGRLAISKLTLAGGVMVTCPPLLRPGPLLVTVTVVVPVLSGEPEMGVSATIRSISSGRTVTKIRAWSLSTLTSFTSSDATVTRPSCTPSLASRTMTASIDMSSEVPAAIDGK